VTVQRSADAPFRFPDYGIRPKVERQVSGEYFSVSRSLMLVVEDARSGGCIPLTYASDSDGGG
jgi:hypothetical protein